MDLHNLLRWLILILLVVNIVSNYLKASKPFTRADEKWGLWLMICAHTTFIVGVAMWLTGLLQLTSNARLMQNDVLRNKIVEHPIAMIIAIAFITIGKIITKKNISDKQKHKRSAHLYLLAFIIIVAMIPWATSSLVPGM